MSDCPATIDEVTSAWCTSAMRSVGALVDGEAVVSVSAEPLGAAFGFYSRMYRLRYTTSGASGDQDRTAVVKLAADEPFNRELGFGLGYYEREFHFYADLAGAVPVAVPRFLGGEIDAEAQRCVMVFEDLSHGQILEQYEALSVEQLGGVVDELARLHSHFAADAALDEMAWIGPVSTQAAALDMGIDVALDRYHPEPGGPDPLAPVADVVDAIRGRAVDVMAPLDGGPRTLVHTDCRSVNLVFGLQSDPTRPVFLDWQGTARGNGILDVASIVVLGLDIDDRRAADDDLLARYLSGMAAGGVTIDADEARDAFVRGVLTQLLLSVAQLDLTAHDPTDQWGVWLLRARAAVLDHGLPTGF